MNFVIFGLIGLVVLGVLGTVGMFVAARVVPRPDDVNNGSLSPCPEAPNCVSTEATDEKHSIPLITFDTSAEQAKEAMVTVLRRMPRVTLITVDEFYLYAEARTETVGFVDDLEFVVDPEKRVIRFRSAARLGQDDLGNNRKRMEEIRELFNTTLRNAAS